MTDRKYSAIAVYMSASKEVSQKYVDLAYHFGQELAVNGITMVYGAGTQGLMGATAKGALSKDGRVVGVIPGLLTTKEGILPGLAEVYHTDTMRERQAKMEELSEANISLPGGFGTLYELTEAMVHNQLNIIRQPVYLLDPDGFFDGLAMLALRMWEEGILSEDHLHAIRVFSSVTDAIEHFTGKGRGYSRSLGNVALDLKWK